MKKRKKYFIASLGIACLSTLFITSCSSTTLAPKDDNKYFSNAYNEFELENIKDHSNIYAKDINTEQQLLNYYKKKSSYNDVNYNFLSITNENDNLIVEYNIIYKNFQKLKIITLNGFKSTQPIEPQPPIVPPIIPDKELELFQKLENETKRFTITKKSNKEFNKIYPSELKDVNKLSEYFDWEEKLGFRYIFEMKPDDLNGTLRIEVDIIVLDDQNNDFSSETKIFNNFTGFKKKSYIQDYNEKILEKAVKLLNIKVKKDISNITINDYLKDQNSNFNKYFLINKTEVEALDSGVFVYPGPVKTEINSNGFHSLFFTLRVQVGGKNSIFANKIIEISGFKQLLSNLDASPNINLKTPANAITYKGKVKPLLTLQPISEQNHKEQTNRVSWETYKLEMIYQVRFWMYQIFYDNFSEINYYIIGGNNVGEKFTTVAEGIINNDMTDLYGEIQKYGPSVTFKRSFKKGQKIKLILEQNIVSTDPRFTWRPAGGWHDYDGFSFEKGCSNINQQNKTNVWITQMATDRKFPIKFIVNDSDVFLNISSWVMRTYMFTIGRKR